MIEPLNKRDLELHKLGSEILKKIRTHRETLFDKVLICKSNRGILPEHLTEGEAYKLIHKYKDSYCTINDRDRLEVYDEYFFTEV